MTRAGSNDLHGAAWEFNRDDALQARNYFASPTQPKPKLKQNQFGGSLGGPLQRNQMFGFGYYEGHRNTSGQTQNIVVRQRRAAERQLSASTTIRDPLTGAALPGNVIPADRISPAAPQADRRLRPARQRRDRHALHRARRMRSTIATRWASACDYQLTQKNSLLVRYLRSDTESITPPTTRPIGNDRGRDAAGRHGLGHASVHVAADQRRALLVQPDRRLAAGDQRPVEQRLRHQRAAATSRSRPGCRTSPSPASSAPATRSSRSSSRLNEVCAVHRRHHLGDRAAFG